MLTKHRIPKSILGFSKMDKNKCPISKIPLYFWSKKSIIYKVGTFMAHKNNIIFVERRLTPPDCPIISGYDTPLQICKGVLCAFLMDTTFFCFVALTIFE